jgi:site-specific DNA recombinase
VTRYVALYCRLSPRLDGSYEGVPAQERWGRKYAASAWPGVPIEVFADAGISAANGDHRPEFERFREWLAAGRIAHAWAVEQTRLERREVEWFQLAAEMDAAGITELHTNRDGIVRVRDDVAGIKAVLAAGEVRKLKRRVNDKLAENAANGQPPGSKPFGYEHGEDENGHKTYVVVSEQAKAIRQAAEWVLAGWSLENIAAELRKCGLRGAHGGKIGAQTVRGMVTRPTAAGHRVHQGRIVGRGNWEPILDEETWQACKLKLSQPRRVTRTDGKGTYPVTEAHRGNPTGRRYLLTGGLARCGVCGHRMVGAMKHIRKQHVPYLSCHPNGGGRGCTGILLWETEKFVVDELFDELDKPEFLDAIAADEHGARRDEITNALDGLDRQRGELATMWATPGELSDTEWKAARRALVVNEQRLRQELAELPPPMIGMDIAGARAAWPDMTLDEKREFIRMFIAKVSVKRARPGTKGFDSNRVDIEWRTL